MVFAFTTLLNLTTLYRSDYHNVMYLLNYFVDINYPHHLIINYIRDDCELSYFMDKVLFKRRSYINRPSIKTLPMHDLTKGKHIKSNIITTSNYSYLIHLFERKTSNQFSFVAHGLVLIFFQGIPGDFNEIPFKLATGLQGIRILLIQGIFTSETFLKYINQQKILVKWTKQDGFLFQDIRRLYWTPNFIPGTEFTISTFHCPPFIYTNATYVYDGMEYLIISHVGKNWPLNFLIYQETNESLYSRSKQDLLFGKSDIGVCSQWLVSLIDHSDKCDISKPYSQTCVTFLVPKPHLLPILTFIFHPLHLLVWFAIISITLIVSLSLHCISLCYQYYKDPFLNIEYSFRILFLQPIPEFPPSNFLALRIVLCIWTICSLILTTAYSAGFASILSTDRYTKKISTLNDMFDNGIYWGSQDSSVRNLFKAETLIDRKLRESFVVDESLEKQDLRIKKDESGVLVKRLTTSSNYITDTENLEEYGQTHLKVLSDCAGEYAIALVFQKNSPFTLIFDKKISQLNEHGFLISWYRRITKEYKINYMENFFTDKITNSTNVYKPLSFQMLQGIFYLWLLFIIISFTLFLYELKKKRFNLDSGQVRTLSD